MKKTSDYSTDMRKSFIGNGMRQTTRRPIIVPTWRKPFCNKGMSQEKGKAPPNLLRPWLARSGTQGAPNHGKKGKRLVPHHPGPKEPGATGWVKLYSPRASNHSLAYASG